MLETKDTDGILTVSFKNTDRLNALITEPVKESLLGHFKTPETRLVLDLQGIKFIDSSGFNVLLSAMKAASGNQGKLKICNVSPETMELFEVLQLHNVFEIYPTEKESIDSFKSVE